MPPNELGDAHRKFLPSGLRGRHGSHENDWRAGSPNVMLMNGEMNRVAVIGNGGGGKSTLARKLGAALRIDVLVIDKVQFGPGLSRTPEPELYKIHDEVLARSRWIIDGFGPWPAMERRFALADTIVFIDFPVWIHFMWAARRHYEHRDSGPGAPYGDLPAAPSLEQMFEVLWRVHEEYTPRFRALFDGYRADKNIVHLTSPQELDAFTLRFCS